MHEREGLIYSVPVAVPTGPSPDALASHWGGGVEVVGEFPWLPFLGINVRFTS